MIVALLLPLCKTNKLLSSVKRRSKRKKKERKERRERKVEEKKSSRKRKFKVN